MFQGTSQEKQQYQGFPRNICRKYFTDNITEGQEEAFSIPYSLKFFIMHCQIMDYDKTESTLRF